MADALPNSDSKLGGNPLITVISAMNNNEYSQQMRQVTGSVELNAANKNMQHLTKAMGSINTNTGGFGWQGWLITAAVGVTIFVIGTGLSFILGPGAEVVADVIDETLFTTVAGDAALDVATDAGMEVVEDTAADVGEEIVGQTFDEAGNMTETVTRETSEFTNGKGDTVEQTVTKAVDGEGGTTKKVTEKTVGDASETITETKGKKKATRERRDGELAETVKGTVDSNGVFTESKGKLSKIKEALPSGPFPNTKIFTKKTVGMLTTTLVAIGMSVMLGAGFNSADSSRETSKFSQQYSSLNYLESIVTNTISLVNTEEINAATSLIQGDQTAVSKALGAFIMYSIPPVQ